MMTKEYSDRNLGGSESGSHSGSSDQSLGNARSAYGSQDYGGRLDRTSIESDRSSNTSQQNFSGAQGKSRLMSRVKESSRGRTSGGFMLLVGGLGLGGALLYLLAPKLSLSGRGRSSSRSREMMVKCGEVMTKDPTCCLPNDTVDKAAQLMRVEDIGPVPIVVDHESRSLVGIITDRDLAIKVVADGRDPKVTKISDVMSTGVATCRPEDDLQKALDLMEGHQVRRIPVVDEDNRIVGIIAQGDVATRVEAPEKTATMIEEISKSSGTGAS